MKRPSKDQKIEALERILKAFCGRSEGTIEYRYFNDKYLPPEVRIECDINTLVDIKTELEFSGNFHISFDTEAYMGDPWMWDKSFGRKRKVPLVKETVGFQLRPEYWKQLDQLKTENKELKKQLKEAKNNGDL